MKAIILAGGFGTRLAHLSSGKPKPLVEVAGTPILERQINFLLSHGMDDIRLSLHHKADQIIEFCERRWPGEFEYVVEPTPLGTGGGLKFASKGIQDEFLVVNADDILRGIDIKKLISFGANAIVCSSVADARSFGLVDIQGEHIAAFSEKPKEQIPGYVNSGWYLLRPNVFNHVSQEAFMLERDVFPALAQKGLLRAFLHTDYWVPVGTEDKLNQAHHDYLTGVVADTI